MVRFTLEESSVGVLGTGIDGFSLDTPNYVVGGYVLESFVVPYGFNYVCLSDVAS